MWNRLMRVILVADPLSDRVPPLTFLTITAGLIALSAALFSEGTAGSSTNTNSSGKNFAIRSANTR